MSRVETVSILERFEIVSSKMIFIWRFLNILKVWSHIPWKILRFKVGTVSFAENRRWFFQWFDWEFVVEKNQETLKQGPNRTVLSGLWFCPDCGPYQSPKRPTNSMSEKLTFMSPTSFESIQLFKSFWLRLVFPTTMKYLNRSFELNVLSDYISNLHGCLFLQSVLVRLSRLPVR